MRGKEKIIENGEWRIENGYRVEDGKWRIED
jgi:hypothetical protein